MDLKTIIQEFLQRPKDELGDRSTYIGASDLACERKGCLEKLTPSRKSFETLLRFKRGDLVESIVKEALDHNEIKHVCQLEAVHPQKPHLKAHLDFTFGNQTEMGVLECKSVSFIPQEPYDGWEKQLYYQMGLLSLNHRQKKIKGAVIALDLQTGDVRIFNGYNHSPLLFKDLEASADRIWQALQNQNPDSLHTNKSPLCAYCHFRSDCPAFFVDDAKVVDLSPIQQDVNQYLDAKLMEKEGKSLSFQAKARIEQFLGEFTAGKAGDTIIKVSARQKETLDFGAFKSAHPDLFEEYKKTTPYTVLTIS
ncbi:MAG: hypothetical protein ACOZF0_21005 [Thermodesulfobacteriota bacterium]